MLAAGSAHLQVVAPSHLVQLGLVGGQLGHLDVHGGAHGRAQVGGAEGQEAQAVIVGEGDALLDVVDGGYQAAVHLSQVTAHLHGDEAEVVLLVAPHQEGLGVIVVDATAGGPEATRVGGLQETISLLEEEVVIDELLLDVLAHAGQGVELALEFSLEAGQGGGHLALHLLVLLLGQAGVEGVSLHGAAAAHAGGDHILARGVEVSKGVYVSPVLGGVLVGLLEARVVVLDDGVEQLSEHCVRLSIGGIDTYSGVVVFQT